jgi:phosphonopyruvate decarboxylase
MEIRKKTPTLRYRDFYNVGAMGHVSSIASGLALGFQETGKSETVFCLDGDGSMIMHMGSLVSNGSLKNISLVHVLINNGLHESVGSHHTGGQNIDFSKIAKECGYDEVYHFNKTSEIDNIPSIVGNKNKKIFIQINVKPGAMKDLGRPTKSLLELKNEYIL